MNDDKYKILIIMTTTGLLAHVDCSTDEYNVLSVEDVNISMPKEWVKISEWLNMKCVDENKFLVVGRCEASDEEVMLYYAHRHLPSTIDNISHKKPFYEFDKICWQVQPTTHSVSFGAHGKLIGAVQDESLFVMDYASRNTKWHKSGTRKFTCIAAHPEQMVVATGDDSGRIVVWNNLFEKSPAKTTFHWHTLPVGDLQFSASGTATKNYYNEMLIIIRAEHGKLNLSWSMQVLRC
jgi:WD40 repeat protein